MKILIAADMEGISGVVHWDHVDPKHADYPRFRRLMTASVEGAANNRQDAFLPPVDSSRARQPGQSAESLC